MALALARRNRRRRKREMAAKSAAYGSIMA
jgi:hypothetical protein